MHKLKHTPGPWGWNGKITRFEIDSKSEKIIDSAIYENSWLSAFNREIDSANARLIAAAPEILECLIEIYDCQFSKNKTLVNLNSAILKSKKIIEKATGLKIEEVLE